MSNASLGALDSALGIIEPVAVAASVLAFLVAVFRGIQWLRVAAFGLILITSVSLSQPFGVRAEGISAERYGSGNLERLDPSGSHTVELLGLGLFQVRPYVEDVGSLLPTDTGPTHRLKTRSWLWPAVLTNGGDVLEMCGTVSACWDPGNDYFDNSLEVVRANDGELRYAVFPPPGSIGGETRYFALSVGVVSPTGMAFWLVAAFAAWVMLRRGSRPRAS